MKYAIFCANPLDPRTVEPDFAAEAGVAREAGFTTIILDHDDLDRRGNPVAALRKSKISDPGVAIYRGWMVRAEAYKQLYEALQAKDIQLLTSPDCYAACHHTPGSYEKLSACMPKTLWVTKESLDDLTAVSSVLAEFGRSPVIIKDWVKSQAAGYWSEACFIPNAADTHQALRVIARFRQLQDDSLVGGIVIKAYIPLVPVGHPAHEHRAFIVGGRAIGCWPRSKPASELAAPPDDLLAQVAAKVPSAFASADFGIDEGGRWWLLEVGDGQVSGLPDETVAAPLFKALAELGDVF